MRLLLMLHDGSMYVNSVVFGFRNRQISITFNCTIVCSRISVLLSIFLVIRSFSDNTQLKSPAMINLFLLTACVSTTDFHVLKK